MKRDLDLYLPLLGLTLMTLAGLMWLWDFTPRIGPKVASPPPVHVPGEHRAKWIGRLGLGQMKDAGDPTQKFTDSRRRAAVDDPLVQDLCSGRDMEGDRAFRSVRAALVANDPTLCGGALERRMLVTPLSVQFGVVLGGLLTVLLSLAVIGGAGFAAVAWLPGELKKRRIRKLLDRDQRLPG